MKLTDKQKRQIIFAVYLLFVIKVIIFKYPFEQLKAIMDTWSKEVVLEGLDTANFTLFKTIHMYIDYSYMLNSFEKHNEKVRLAMEAARQAQEQEQTEEQG